MHSLAAFKNYISTNWLDGSFFKVLAYVESNWTEKYVNIILGI